MSDVRILAKILCRTAKFFIGLVEQWEKGKLKLD